MKDAFEPPIDIAYPNVNQRTTKYKHQNTILYRPRALLLLSGQCFLKSHVRYGASQGACGTSSTHCISEM